MSQYQTRTSTSMKRATISLTMPGMGRLTMQEGKGIVSEKLRNAIKAAYNAFWEAYDVPRDPPNALPDPQQAGKRYEVRK